MMHAGAMPVRCLIVDDNQDFLRAARELLERDGINVVGVVSTGAQAYRAYRELEPDVVLVDIELGEETGFEVARQLAGQVSSRQPRVILISSYSEDDFQDLIADSPAVSFLPKEGLSGTAIRSILARAGGSVAETPQRDSR
jgi:CheY-like chemotaxis protein